MRSSDRKSLKFRPEKILKEILEFIQKVVEDSNASGIVLGLSGGVDSTLTTVLCTRALGKEKVLGVLMPASFTPERDVADALELAKMLEIRSIRINIDGLCETFIRTLDIQTNDNKTKIPLANIRARIRMIILYYYANLNNYLVAGTSDRSETLIGFFTKHGDGAADFFPIRHLYKTQVRELTKYLGIPERMATKPSSPQLYPGHKLADELPYDYDKLDPILIGLFDLHMPPEKVSRMTNVPFDLIKEVITRYNKTEHKRKASPTIEVTMKNKLRYSRRMFEPC